MSADCCDPAAPTRDRRRPLVPVLVCAALALSTLGAGGADADPRLDAAQAHRREVQARLDELLQRLRETEAEEEALRRELEELTAQHAQQRAAAARADAALQLRARAAYIRGAQDPTLSILSSDSPSAAAQQTRLLGLLAEQSRSQYEAADAAQVRTDALTTRRNATARRLQERRASLDAASREAKRLVAEAQRQEQQVRDTIAAEEARRRAQIRASRSRTPWEATPAGVSAPAPAGVACPVGRPHHFSDTWGAARSGGRRHKGTDILASYGTAIYAYESGVVLRTNSSALGGISLYLRGDSGNIYYYTHLAGYVSGIRAGARVSAGQHIARNGDSGNARGIPHLHFEVQPGGGSSVNPYPYVRRACG